MKIYKEKAGVISPEPVWVCIDDCYLYTADTLIMLLITIILGWKSDKYLVG